MAPAGDNLLKGNLEPETLEQCKPTLSTFCQLVEVPFRRFSSSDFVLLKQLNEVNTEGSSSKPVSLPTQMHLIGPNKTEEAFALHN